MARFNRPHLLLKAITRLIDREFSLAHASFLALDEKKQRFVFADSKGTRRFPVNLVKVDMDHPIVCHFLKNRKRLHRSDFLSREGLKAEFRKDGLAGARLRELTEVFSAMQFLKAELVVPGFFKNRLLGLLLIGAKLDGGSFSKKEISFFQILAQDCSMAMQTGEYHQNLVEKNQELEKRIQEVEALRRKDEETQVQVMRSLAQEIYAKDSYTYGHVNQVERLGMMIAREMGLDASGPFGRTLRAGLILHDVGKVGIPDIILKKEAALNDEEWQIMRTHPEKGAKILQPLSDFKEVSEIVLYHHEYWDGTGYPSGLKGGDIPLGARIVSVADAFHAMVSNRCYSRGKSVEFACEELERCAGGQFDPLVVRAFLSALKREMKKRGVGFFKEERELEPSAV